MSVLLAFFHEVTNTPSPLLLICVHYTNMINNCMFCKLKAICAQRPKAGRNTQQPFDAKYLKNTCVMQFMIPPNRGLPTNYSPTFIILVKIRVREFSRPIPNGPSIKLCSDVQNKWLLPIWSNSNSAIILPSCVTIVWTNWQTSTS